MQIRNHRECDPEWCHILWNGLRTIENCSIISLIKIWNSLSKTWNDKMFKFHHLILGIKYGFIRCVNHRILFYLHFIPKRLWNWGCMFRTLVNWSSFKCITELNLHLTLKPEDTYSFLMYNLQHNENNLFCY